MRIVCIANGLRMVGFVLEAAMVTAASLFADRSQPGISSVTTLFGREVSLGGFEAAVLGENLYFGLGDG